MPDRPQAAVHVSLTTSRRYWPTISHSKRRSAHKKSPITSDRRQINNDWAVDVPALDTVR